LKTRSLLAISVFGLAAGDIAAAATPLRTTRSVPFGHGPSLAWVNPAQCDAEGNVFLIPVPKRGIMRVSVDGQKTTRITPADLPAFADADVVKTLSFALDPDGALHALARVDRGARDSQYIVSFDRGGRHISHLKVDPYEMAVGRLERFASGDFFVSGMRLGVGPRVAVMGHGGVLFQDLTEFEEVGRGEASPRGPDHLARGDDGRIYFVPHGSRFVHVIDASGESRVAFELKGAAPNHRLFDLKASGDRLVAVYVEPPAETHSGQAWMAVYDAIHGERRAVYGPLKGSPACYRITGGQEEFTVLTGARLVTMSP
jgi:hypothetical protein